MCQFCGCETEIDGERLYHKERIKHNELKSGLRKLVEKWREMEREYGPQIMSAGECADTIEKLIPGN